MALIYLENVSLSFGEVPLLDKVNFQIEPRERIFLIGRNGVGKSCLLKVILDQLPIDDGRIHREPGLKIAELSQDLPDSPEMTVYEFVAEGLKEVGLLLKKYHRLTQKPGEMAEKNWLIELEETQKQLEAKEGWHFIQTIESILTRLELPADSKMGSLSGGWQRRVGLARALVNKPDLLLLDEPTNHLDLATIEWLEEYLEQYSGSVLCVTHDRTLLKKLSKRIIELDRGRLTSWSSGYDQYLVDKEHFLATEIKQNQLFDKKLAKEETWIRQGIKARRTRNEGRVRALKKLRQEREHRLEFQGKPKFTTGDTALSGELVVNAEAIHYTVNHQCLVKNFTIRICRGDKIALVGPNGVGKSTLLKLLLGEISPQNGKVELGTNLRISYFDQLRSGIDPELSAIENVGGGRETITINGSNKHIISYLSDFLFTPERIRTPVKNLSGGECNRLLLAKLFSLPNNLLVLDEPTNDLDIESLELLEEILGEYKGTLLLVSHDRTFVNQVATSTLYFSGGGKITEYIGGYDAIPFLRVIKQSEPNLQRDRASTKNPADIRFNSKMKRELEEIPAKIAHFERIQASLQQVLSDPAFYHDKKGMAEKLSELKSIDTTLEGLYERWEELELIKNNKV